MRTRILALTTAAIALGAALPAAAQDVAGPFTGARVEVLAGYENLQDGGDGESEGRDGLTYGVAAGYDVQLGGFVVGAEGEWSDSTTKARAFNLVDQGDRLRLRTGRDLYIGGRIGTVISPAALLYAKAGYTNARLKADYTGATPALSFSERENLDGFRVGAGIEYKITPTTYVKGEYRYSHYGKLQDTEIDADKHQLMAGVGFRF